MRSEEKGINSTPGAPGAKGLKSGVLAGDLEAFCAVGANLGPLASFCFKAVLVALSAVERLRIAVSAFWRVFWAVI